MSFEKGVKVKVIDNSWCVKLEDGKMEKGYPTGVFRGRKNITYEVMETNCKLPIYKRFKNDPTDEGEINDTIIKNVDDNSILFTQEEFLEKVDDKVYFSELEIGQPYKYKNNNYISCFIKINDRETLIMKDWKYDAGEVVDVFENIKITPITMKELKKEMINNG